MPVASHDQKCHVTPHFEYPYPRNVMVTLMMPSASPDADTGANIDPKSHVAHHFDLWNSVVPLMMP